MKKLLALLAGTFLLAGLTSCDLLETEETATDTGANYTYQVQWDAELDGATFATGSASLVDASGTSLAGFDGAMALSGVTATKSTESLFGAGSIQYVHSGADTWGGIFTQLTEDNAVDFSALTTVKIAIKGDLPDTLGAFGVKLEGGNSAAQELNLMDYTPVASGDWDVYSIPFTDFTTIEKDSFRGVGLWNPKESEDVTTEGTYLATDILVDIAFN